MKNEILEEVWRIRAEFAREHGNNIDAILAAVRERERHPLTRMVDRSQSPEGDAVETETDRARSAAEKEPEDAPR